MASCYSLDYDSLCTMRRHHVQTSRFAHGPTSERLAKVRTVGALPKEVSDAGSLVDGPAYHKKWPECLSYWESEITTETPDLLLPRSSMLVGFLGYRRA